MLSEVEVYRRAHARWRYNTWHVFPPTIQERLADLERQFGEYVERFNAHPPFSQSQLENHRRTLGLRRKFASASDALHDPEFADSLAEALRSWEIGGEHYGTTHLVQPTAFRQQLQSISLAVTQLEHLSIDDPNIDDGSVARKLWHIIRGLEIVVTSDGDQVQRKVASGTKTLHHVLPDLVFPIDNEYTATLFGWSDLGHQQEERFKFAFSRIAEIAKTVAPQSYVVNDRNSWNSCTSKVLDNAIVGYCRHHKLMSRNKQRRRRDQAILHLA